MILQHTVILSVIARQIKDKTINKNTKLMVKSTKETTKKMLQIWYLQIWSTLEQGKNSFSLISPLHRCFLHWKHKSRDHNPSPCRVKSFFWKGITSHLSGVWFSPSRMPRPLTFCLYSQRWDGVRLRWPTSHCESHWAQGGSPGCGLVCTALGGHLSPGSLPLKSNHPAEQRERRWLSSNVCQCGSRKADASREKGLDWLPSHVICLKNNIRHGNTWEPSNVQFFSQANDTLCLLW